MKITILPSRFALDEACEGDSIKTANAPECRFRAVLRLYVPWRSCDGSASFATSPVCRRVAFVKADSTRQLAGRLSGGNQQKVIVAREFSRAIKLLIASQPTRGLDVGSIEYIHGRIIEKRDEGTAVLLVSSELDEIMALSDRIAVMYRGQIVEIVKAAETSKEQLGLLMAGLKREADEMKTSEQPVTRAERVF